MGCDSFDERSPKRIAAGFCEGNYIGPRTARACCTAFIAVEVIWSAHHTRFAYCFTTSEF
jgi:hypothetical protein